MQPRRGMLRMAPLLELRVVVRGEGVEADHLLAAIEQRLAGMEADEPGSAGDEHFHGGHLVK